MPYREPPPAPPPPVRTVVILLSPFGRFAVWAVFAILGELFLAGLTPTDGVRHPLLIPSLIGYLILVVGVLPYRLPRLRWRVQA